MSELLGDFEQHERLPLGRGGRFYGVYAAKVCALDDPDGLGRVKVQLPWSPDASGNGYEAWARIATLMAGGNRGSWFIPDDGDEVLIAFEAGDSRWPYVVGALWNGRDLPPESMDRAGDNNRKSIRSRNGVLVALDDTKGKESLTLSTPGKQSVTLADSPAGIEIRDNNGNSIILGADGITISTSGMLALKANTVEVTAGSVTVKAPLADFSGMVKSQAIVTTSVQSASYTPGAGNLW